MLLRCTESY